MTAHRLSEYLFSMWLSQEFFRREWMFKLVGDDSFSLENLHCVLRVDPAPGFSYKYSLFVDGKPFEQFKHCQAKALRIWETSIGDNKYRIVLGKTVIHLFVTYLQSSLTHFIYICAEKDTLNIFVNGLLREEEVKNSWAVLLQYRLLFVHFSNRVNLLTAAPTRNGNKTDVISTWVLAAAINERDSFTICKWMGWKSTRSRPMKPFNLGI